RYYVRSPHPPASTLFPYTTLFRSRARPGPARAHRRCRAAPGDSHPERRDLPPVPLRGRVRLDHGVPRDARADDPPRRLLEEELRSEEHTSELQSRFDLVCRLLLEK